MPHISKIKLKKDHSDKLYFELLRTFERSFKKGKTKLVFNQFLTDTEKLMFTKRLAIMALLSKGASNADITKFLSVSPSTVEKMSLKFEYGSYDAIIKHGLGQNDIWGILEQIFTAGGLMPSKVGKDRWQKLNKDVYNNKLMKS